MTNERKDELKMELVKLSRKRERAERAFLKDQFILYGISEVWNEGQGWDMFPEYISNPHIDAIQNNANKRLRKSANRLQGIVEEINTVHSQLYPEPESEPYVELQERVSEEQYDF